MFDWTPENQMAALKQGWGVFHLDGNEMHPTIQTYDEDELERFKNDGEAINFVQDQYGKGDALAMQAVNYIIRIYKKSVDRDYCEVCDEMRYNSPHGFCEEHASEDFICRVLTTDPREW
jgi:hypothetical protein